MDPFTFALILLGAISYLMLLPAVGDAYRFLTRSKRKAATRARLARLPPPEDVLGDASGHEIVAYLRELLADDGGDGLDDEDVKARFEGVVRIVEQREARMAAAASSSPPSA
jgi:hypothetical protein